MTNKLNNQLNCILFNGNDIKFRFQIWLNFFLQKIKIRWISKWVKVKVFASPESLGKNKGKSEIFVLWCCLKVNISTSSQPLSIKKNFLHLNNWPIINNQEIFKALKRVFKFNSPSKIQLRVQYFVFPNQKQIFSTWKWYPHWIE